MFLCDPGMLVKLNLDRRGHDMSVISSVAKELFSDGITNWGRIASLLAFGAVVARYEKESGRGDCVSLVAEELSFFLMHDQKEWLLKNNSWVSWRYTHSFNHVEMCVKDKRPLSFLVHSFKLWIFLHTHSLCWNAAAWVVQLCN